MMVVCSTAVTIGVGKRAEDQQKGQGHLCEPTTPGGCGAGQYHSPTVSPASQDSVPEHVGKDQPFAQMVPETQFYLSDGLVWLG